MNRKYLQFLFILLISVLFLFLSFPSEALKGKRSSDGRYTDNGDGTITDSQTGLMWTKKDSGADTGGCIDWNASKSYVIRLNTGGYTNWRLPTLSELKGIYEESKNHKMGFEYKSWRSEYPLSLDSIFADRAAYWYWSSETIGSCCARSFGFESGKLTKSLRDICYNEGGRAVRR